MLRLLESALLPPRGDEIRLADVLSIVADKSVNLKVSGLGLGK